MFKNYPKSQKKDLSLRVKVKPTDWNEKKNIIKKSDVEYLRKNKYLRKYQNKATDIIDKHFLSDKPLSWISSKRLIKNKAH